MVLIGFPPVGLLGFARSLSGRGSRRASVIRLSPDVNDDMPPTLLASLRALRETVRLTTFLSSL
jgi:hypothetical protein